MTIRIPSDQLDPFLDQVGKIGTVTYTNKSSEDVTLDYIDVESRIEALEVEQERLLTLLESAQIWNSHPAGKSLIGSAISAGKAIIQQKPI